ncbi:MAG TPA: flagellar motor switch protein FliM [Candidatus Saccharimonadales bacterium]|nr:flagellar motor switch protein FliM [Candidatus Saccharimonadales bacterium]
MAGILSQEEIDALMSAVSTGDLEASPGDPGMPAQNVTGYDFRRPYRLTKEEIRTLTGIHESFARLLANSLSAYLRCVVEVSLVSVSGVTYAEYQQALPNPTGLIVLSAPPFEGGFILELNQSLLLAMIDRLFGGPGLLGSEGKHLTTLEETVIQKIVRRVLPDLTEAWKPVVGLQPEVDVFETNPQFVSTASPGDMVLFVSFEIQLPKASGFASLCFQHRDVEVPLSRAGAAGASGQRQRRPTPIPGELWREGIAPTTLPVTGVLGHARIRVGELLDLRVGDVIRLDSTPAGSLPLLVAGQPKGAVRLGRVGRHRALELTSLET